MKKLLSYLAIAIVLIMFSVFPVSAEESAFESVTETESETVDTIEGTETETEPETEPDAVDDLKKTLDEAREIVAALLAKDTGVEPIDEIKDYIASCAWLFDACVYLLVFLMIVFPFAKAIFKKIASGNVLTAAEIKKLSEELKESEKQNEETRKKYAELMNDNAKLLQAVNILSNGLTFLPAPAKAAITALTAGADPAKAAEVAETIAKPPETPALDKIAESAATDAKKDEGEALTYA